MSAGPGSWRGTRSFHLHPDELRTVLSTLRRVLEDGGSLLVSFFAGPRVEAFEHPAATAYRWSMTAMVEAIEGARFEITDRQWHPGRHHATVTAKAS